MKKYLPIFIGIVLLLATWLVTDNLGDNNSTETSTNISRDNTNLIGSTVSTGNVIEFSFFDYDGNLVISDDFQGTPMVVNSWASWCPFFINEMLDFGTVQQELGDSIIFIAINRAETLGTAKGYTDELDGAAGLLYLMDPEDSFYKSIGGFSMPETLFIDGNGVVQLQRRGQMTIEEIRLRANELIN